MRWILIALTVLFIGLQYRLWVGPASWAEVAALERELDERRQINKQLAERNKVLENEVRNLKEGLDGVEGRARSELGLIKQGETFFLIVDSDK